MASFFYFGGCYKLNITQDKLNGLNKFGKIITPIAWVYAFWSEQINVDTFTVY